MGQSAAPPQRSLAEAVVASTIGTMIEWYDFFLYGIAVVVVFPIVFFPGHDPFADQILSISTFTIGFLARPFGGMVFGYMGDRLGRKAALVTTLLLMGISTLAIGFLPTYQEIGIAAPLILAALRLLQGLGVGGEWGGAVLFALEHGHSGRRGFYASWPQAGVPLGLLASTGVMTACQSLLTREEFLAWGWRVPFYLSGLLIVVGLLIRIRIVETPLFAKLQRENLVSQAPVRETLTKHWRQVLLVAGTRLAENSCFYLFTVWIISYGREVLRMPQTTMLLAVNLTAACELVAIPVFGALSDRWSRRRVYMAGCLFLALAAFPFFALMQTREPAIVVSAIVVVMIFGHATLYSVQASLIPELFGTRVRCTGASLGYQLGSPLAGGLAPLIAAFLANSFPGKYWPLAVYVILVAAISFGCIWRLAETSNRDITVDSE